MMISPIEEGLLQAIQVGLYVATFSAMISGLISSICYVYIERCDNRLQRSSFAIAAITTALYAFAIIKLDGSDSLTRTYFDANSRHTILIVAALVILTFLCLAIRPSTLSGKELFKILVRPLPFSIVGGFTGYVIGYPSFGQTTFGEVGGVLLSGFGVALSFFALRQKIHLKLSPESESEGGSNNGVSSPSIDTWIYASGASFLCSAFLVYIAAGIWGYRAAGFEYCREIYGPIVDSQYFMNGTDKTSNPANDLFFEFCKDVMSSLSRKP